MAPMLEHQTGVAGLATDVATDADAMRFRKSATQSNKSTFLSADPLPADAVE